MLLQKRFVRTKFDIYVFITCYLCLFTYTQFTYHVMLVSFDSNTTGITSGAGTAYPFVAPEFTLGFY